VELSRAWRGFGAALADGLDAAAGHPGPEPAELRRLDTPVGLVGCLEDAVHPADVARAWLGLIPRAALVEITFAQLGADRAALGRAAVAALAQAHAR
ncbi:MAG: alpha/beta hydrolase, partial [Thermocrispum sp.]